MSTEPDPHAAQPTHAVEGGDWLDRWIARLAGAFIVAGIILRVRQYLFDRSLWFDETLLSLNIIDHPLAQLLQPLDNHQAAPAGFLVLEKLAVQAFGTSEYALRLVPLLAGVAALFLFYRVLRATVGPGAGAISLGLFALSSLQIGFSDEVKQYSSDAAVALLLLMAALALNRRSPTIRTLAAVAFVGAAAIWFSHPAVFVLAGTGLCLLVFALRDGDWMRVRQLSVVGLAWTVSFVAFYVVALRRLSNDPFMNAVWSDAFVPWDLSYWTLNWLVDNFFDLFRYPAGITLPGLGVFAFVIACTARLDEQTRRKLWIVISPALVVFAAAALHRYPFQGRFLNFLAPSLLLFIGVGIYHVIAATKNEAPAIGLGLIALLFVHPLWTDSYSLLRPHTQEEIRSVLNYVREHKQTDDVLYLYWRTEPAFSYYLERWNFDDRLQRGRTPRPLWSTGNGKVGDLDTIESTNWTARSEIFLRDLDAIRGKARVWVVFYHVAVFGGIDEEQWFLLQLDRMGTDLDRFSADGASAYLYDLSKKPDHTAARSGQTDQRH